VIAVSDLVQARRVAPLLWERYSRDRKRSVAAAPHRPRPELWPDEGLHAAWLGHSTVLLKIDGVTILTDPVFSRRIGLNFGPLTIGLKRLVEPALRLKQLRRPDLILLSHAHMDHFDIPSLRLLESGKTQVITAAKTSDLLRVKRYGGVDELAWGETARVGDVTVRAFEVNHWGARMRSDTYRGFNGYLIQTPRYCVVFGGDTAMTDTFRALRSSRRVNLAIMPIGAYNPWIRAHCTPEQALKMADDAGAELILPVHHRTFQLSSEPAHEPIERLSSALANAPERLALQEIGQETHPR
jgi:L-ascorbate metabolism protein UlaG (beta-lactamase superfamily)